MDIRLLEGAKRDLRSGWFFYELQSPGLGDRFLDAIEADVRLLPAYAGIHLQVNGFHRLLIKRFPFAPYDLIPEHGNYWVLHGGRAESIHSITLPQTIRRRSVIVSGGSRALRVRLRRTLALA